MRANMPTITVKKDIKNIKRKLIEKNTETLMVIGCGICARIRRINLVKTAFYNVAEKKGWKMKFIEGVGLVLMR